MNFIKGNIVGLVAIVIAIAGLYYPVASVFNVGGVTNYDEVDATAMKSGSSGTRFGNVIYGYQTCVFIDGESITASTSRQIDCAVTGVVSGDTVFVMESTTTKSGVGNGWSIQGASASSTSGFVTALLKNETGANNVPAATATTTQVLVIHPVTSVPGL